MGTETDSGTGVDSALRERVREWFLLDGSRVRVAVLVTVALYAWFLSVSVSGLAPYADLQPLYYAFSELISGNLTLITVVVAINQLLLSREFHTPGELESQIEGVEEYRRDVESITGRVAPVEPPEFLRLLAQSTRQRAQELGGLAVNETSDEVRAELDSVVASVTAHVDDVDALVAESDQSTFEALATTLTTNYSPQIRRLRRIEHRNEDLPDHVDDGIHDLVDALEDVDVARQYFKTVYLQEELATLSRQLFYVGFVSVPVVVGGLLLFSSASRASVPVRQLRFLVPAILTVGLGPLSLLFPYIVRVAVVTQRTVSTIPFTTSVQER